jgi:uncharacterized protein HemX
MKKLLSFLVVGATLLFASGQEQNESKDHNKTTTQKNKSALDKAIEKEKKYAQEQRFYFGKEYNLKAEEVDPETVKKVPVIEPEYDFDMDTGVYDD